MPIKLNATFSYLRLPCRVDARWSVSVTDSQIPKPGTPVPTKNSVRGRQPRAAAGGREFRSQRRKCSNG